MAFTADSTHQKRAGLGSSVSVNVQGHNGFETTDRNRRHERRFVFIGVNLSVVTSNQIELS